MATWHFDSARGRLTRAGHPVWKRAFSEMQRKKLTDEDIEAGYRIPGVLAGVVLLGLVMMVVSVWLTM